MRIYFSEILVLALFHPHFLRDLLGKSTQIQPGLALGSPWVSDRFKNKRICPMAEGYG